MICICSPKSEKTKQQMKDEVRESLGLLDLFGKKYIGQIKGNLPSDLRDCIEKICMIFSEIQFLSKKGENYFPLSDELSTKITHFGANQDGYIPTFRYFALKFEPYPQVVRTFLNFDKVSLEQVQTKNLEAFNLLQQLLQFNENIVLSDIQSKELAHFLFSKNAIFEISFAELVDVWLKDRGEKREKFWQQIDGASNVKIHTTEELFNIGRLGSFQDYLVNTSLKFLAFRWEVDLTIGVTRYFSSLFQNEQIRSDVVFFTRDLSELKKLDCSNMELSSTKIIEKFRVFFSLNLDLEVDYRSILLEEFFLYDFDPRSVSTEDLIDELKRRQSSFFGPKIDLLRSFISNSDHENSACIASKLSYSMVWDRFSLSDIFNEWIVIKKAQEVLFKDFFIDKTIDFVFSRYKLEKTDEVIHYLTKVFKTEKVGIEIVYFLWTNGDFHSVDWNDLDLVCKKHLQHLQILFQVARKKYQSFFISLFLQDTANLFIHFNEKNWGNVSISQFIILVEKIGIDSCCIPLFCLLSHYYNLDGIIQIFLNLENYNGFNLNPKEIYEFVEENKKHFDMRFFKFIDLQAKVLAEFKSSEVEVQNPKSLFMTPPIKIEAEQLALSLSPQNARRFIQMGKRDISDLRRELFPEPQARDKSVTD